MGTILAFGSTLKGPPPARSKSLSLYPAFSFYYFFLFSFPPRTRRLSLRSRCALNLQQQ